MLKAPVRSEHGLVRVLTFSTLYPNAAQPTHGLFVEHRLRQLVRSQDVDARVVAPVPWFPVASPIFGRYAAFARAPRSESRHGLEILHPRFAVIPKVGMWAAPDLLYRGALGTLRRLRRSGFEFDVIDAHFLYPDGVAATLLGRTLGVPVVLTARGSDVTLYRDFPGPRGRIVAAARRAAAVIAVSKALRSALVEMGVPAEHVHTMRNGVDLELFRPGDRAGTRARLGLAGHVLLSIGNLVANKGHDIAIRALRSLPDTTLVVIGAGPERARLARIGAECGVADRVRLVAPVPQETLPEYYSAADATVLCSAREGWPNVLLESMACGTPVLATAVWGVPEIVSAPPAGRLLGERSPAALVRAARELLASAPDRAATRRYAEGFSWDDTSRAQATLFAHILRRDLPPAGARGGEVGHGAEGRRTWREC